jgi:tRNA 2-thiouridine synthesizing protein E
MHRDRSSPSNNTDTSSDRVADRLAELAAHRWTRAKSHALAGLEGIELSDEQWAVVVFLRKYYLYHGRPASARTTAKALNEHFSGRGGNRYLHRLFAGGPVAQGSRFANLRSPAYATDSSFGTSY